MGKFTPSKQQKDIFKFILDGEKNAVISAVAGSGKTTTLLEALKLIPEDKTILFMAFNKSIAKELRERVPQRKSIKVMTVHGFGIETIRKSIKEPSIDNSKYRKILKDIIQFYKGKNDDVLDVYKFNKECYRFIESMANTVKNGDIDIDKFVKNVVDLSNLGRLHLIDFDTKPIGVNDLNKLADIHSINNEDGESTVAWYLSKLGLHYQDVVDFTDMIMFPNIMNLSTDVYDYVFIDECLPSDTIISTENGRYKLKKLFSLFKKNKILPELKTYNEEKKLFENKKIKKIWSNGLKDVYYVMLGGKRKIKSTLNHKFLTQDGWKRLDELKIGDAIISDYNEQPYHQFLNESQKNIFIGSIMGDGNIDHISLGISRIRIIHGMKQEEYIKWKSTFFKAKIEIIGENGYSKKPAMRFQSKGYYCSYTKENVIKLITPQSIAISWMDDGSLYKNELGGRLYSFADDEKLINLLCIEIFNKFKIKGVVHYGYSSTSNKKYFYISFNKENMFHLSELISPFIHESMSYKILTTHHYKISNDNWVNHNVDNIGCMVVTKEFSFHKKEEVFDMEVEDNHNFILTSSSFGKKIKSKDFGIITHNCQDLNTCQRLLMEKAIKPDTGRFIAVGDPKQAIYAFAGADYESYQKLKKIPNTIELPLSVTYRCAEPIVKWVKHLNPLIKHFSKNKTGVVHETFSYKDIQDGDMVLCRNTFPIVALCIKLLSEGKKSYIIGSDIGMSLILMIENCEKKTEDFTMINVFSRLYHDKDKLIEKVMSNHKMIKSEAMEDSQVIIMNEKIQAIEVLSEGISNPHDVIRKIKELFSNDKKSGICLSNMHKSKGLESERVFIIHQELIPSKYAKLQWQIEQERNLEYVAYTRAKTTLGFVNDFDAFKSYKSQSENVVKVNESKHIGSPKMKMKFELKVVEKRNFKGPYGDTIIYEMVDKNGNLFSKFGEISEDFLLGTDDKVEVNSRVSFYGIIKSHSEFKGSKITNLGKITQY